MAYVIAVCGSGGKTTLVKSLAKKYANENKKVCVTTTTHMWYDEDVKSAFIEGIEPVVAHTVRDDIVVAKHCEPQCMALDEYLSKNKIESGRVYFIANVNKEKELITPLSESEYKIICEEFDCVIIEADGSRSMPMKIPRMGEPVIPENANEIIIAVGMEAVGREIGAVCHRFNEFYGNDKYLSDNKINSETIVTEELLDNFVKHYYYEPLKQEFSSAKVSLYKNDFAKGSNNLSMRIAIVLCAAGFSKRFGSNKLLTDVSHIVFYDGTNKKLYQLMIDKLLGAKELLINRFNKACEVESGNDAYKDSMIEKDNLPNKKHLDVDVVVVSQYEEILNDENYENKVIMLRNDNASEGLSASIKLAVEFCKGLRCVMPTNESNVTDGIYDAIVFVNADLPYLPINELSNFIFNSILNKNGIAAMYSDDYKNPAYFEKKYFDEILNISGDKGPRELFDKYKMNLYKYYISDKYLIDIDTEEDFK